MRGTSTYSSWTNMKQRCFNPKHIQFADYGGRGVTVCDRWLGFEEFYGDMGTCPEGHSIEREENNGNYEPGNCHWATRTEQCRNRRTNKPLTHEGRTQLEIEWAEELGMSHKTLNRRLNVYKWTVARAVTTPLRGSV